MEKFISKEKMNKKARRALDQSRRGTWGAQSPITRTVESKKMYNRKKNRWDKNPTDFFRLHQTHAACDCGELPALVSLIKH
ncbi:MAG: hypothetical protein ABF449_14655 [Ethanoligenens sp.]|uniref:hypothetical protein n=1 Tax=Ethanoligenens sp. TaxID=2099655 RepID=UPI0039ED0CFC